MSRARFEQGTDFPYRLFRNNRNGPGQARAQQTEEPAHQIQTLLSRRIVGKPHLQCIISTLAVHSTQQDATMSRSPAFVALTLFGPQTARLDR